MASIGGAASVRGSLLSVIGTGRVWGWAGRVRLCHVCCISCGISSASIFSHENRALFLGIIV